ncbi:uncharacterized protein [Palaemon carinicauda]|uniref:uncharacterized protein n=1 Tax=Palaemon carinicauda TaxID=392227 RepID=UPI0035B5A68A
MGEFHSPAEAGLDSAGQYEGEAKPQELASGGTGGGREGGGGEDLPVCECTFSADTDYTCKCPSMNGIIKRQDIPDGIYTLKYYIQSDTPGTVIAYFKYDDVKTLSSLCKLTIGETVFDSPSDLSETNVVYADTETPIEVYAYFKAGLCDYTLQYYTFLPTTEILILNATEGYLTAPADETGMFSYKPNAEVLWILQPDIPVSEFNFTIEYLDLGLPENNIHGSNKMNFTEGDFLVIGPGEDLLQGNDNMFYGIREPEDLKKVVTLGGTSHVYFTSTVTKFNASGFNISYTTSVFEPTTTPFPVTTVNPPSPEDEQTTYLASIEGASTDKTILNQTIDSFKVAMVNMSSEYVRMKSWVTKGPITTDSVIIYEVLTCDTSLCNPECLAFNFSIAALDYNDAWIFTAPVIEDMLFTPELQSSLDHIGKDCSVCDEDRTLNLWMYIGVPVGIVVFATILSLVLWTMGSRSNLEASRRRYEQEIADRMDDNRRRSSGDVSILGVGGSIASRGSLDSRRFTMPFPKANVESSIMEEVEGVDTVDMSGFKEYDPDLGRVDPAEFGISTEFLNNDRAMAHYGNPGFIDDEGHTIFHRGHSIATTAGTYSDDSDDGGAVSFSGHGSNRKRKTPTISSIEATADVHMSDEGGISVNGACGETAL